MMNEGNNGVEVDMILDDLARGVVRDGHGRHIAPSSFDMNGIEIDDIIRESERRSSNRRSVRWHDRDHDAVMCLPPDLIPSDYHDDGDDDVRDVAASSSASRPWRRTGLLIVSSLFAFAALIAVGYGVGYGIDYAIASRSASSSSSEMTTSFVSSAMMEDIDDTDTDTPTYSPTRSPLAERFVVVETISNDVMPGLRDGGDDGGGQYGQDGPTRRRRDRKRRRNRSGLLRYRS